jgi:hypothetical protein
MNGTKDHFITCVEPDVICKHARKRTVKTQLRLQRFMQRTCVKLQCQLLYVPYAWGNGQMREYFMTRVDDSCPLSLANLDPNVQEELASVHRYCFKAGIFPADFELFQQPDGRIAMLDFDKFGMWHSDGSVRFPWGHTLNLADVQQYLFTLLGKRCVL